MNTKACAALLLAGALALGGCGVTTLGLHDDPGYAPLDFPSSREAESELNLALGSWSLRSALWVVAKADAQEAEKLQALRAIKGLRVRVYHVVDGHESIRRRIDNSAAKMAATGWQKVVSVVDQGERVLVMVKRGNDGFDGLAVLTVGEQEAAFVNVIGRMDSVFFQQLATLVNSDRERFLPVAL